MSGRSALATKHIVISLIAKGVGIICSLLVVPMTIEYVNPTQYGIWMTVSSIVGWIAFFDLGLANGFRNKFTESIARQDDRLAREYVSTTYFTLGIIACIILPVILLANHFIDWSVVLDVDSGIREELRSVFAILCTFFCINLVANTFSILLTANQQPGYAALINCLGQVLSLIAIFILTKTTTGSLLNLSLYFASIPSVVLVLCSIIAFHSKAYRAFAPRFRFVRISHIWDILGKGIQFFIICLSMILIFQVSNIVLSREIGPLSVTQYNLANKYFNILYMVMIIIITPFWSAFTDAYTKNDTQWMKQTISRMETIWMISVGIALVLLAGSSLFYKIWIKDSVTIPFNLSAAMALFVLTHSLGDLYMYMINGIGTIRIQLIVYVLFALIAWPCLVWSCRLLGVYGVVLFPSLVYAVQAILGKIQLTKLMAGKARGIWAK